MIQDSSLNSYYQFKKVKNPGLHTFVENVNFLKFKRKVSFKSGNISIANIPNIRKHRIKIGVRIVKKISKR